MANATEIIVGGIAETVVTWEDEFDDAADLLRKMEEIFLRPDEFVPMKEHDRILQTEVKKLDEFNDPKKLAKIRPKVIVQTATKTLQATETALGFARACWVAALAQVALSVAVDVLTDDDMTRRKRRRRKTFLCVRKCLDIVEEVRRDLWDGYALTRALETEDDSAGMGIKRNRRRYPSRR